MRRHDRPLSLFLLALWVAGIATFSFGCSERRSEGQKPVIVEDETPKNAFGSPQNAQNSIQGEYEHVAQVQRFEGGIEPDIYKARKVVNQLFNYSLGVCSQKRECPPDLDALKDAINTQYGIFWPKDPWGKPYQYKRIDEQSCDVWSSGPDGVDGNEDDVHVAKANRDDLPD